MKLINLAAVPVDSWRSPKGKFAQDSRCISIALGRDEKSDRLSERHPFDLEHVTLPVGAVACPYHAHSAQWEMFIFLEGRGRLRTPDGEREVGPGDIVLHPPGSPHQVTTIGATALSYYLIADNPINDCCYYPDSDKWLLPASLGGGIFRGAKTAYLDGEE